METKKGAAEAAAPDYCRMGVFLLLNLQWPGRILDPVDRDGQVIVARGQIRGQGEVEGPQFFLALAEALAQKDRGGDQVAGSRVDTGGLYHELPHAGDRSALHSGGCIPLSPGLQVD